MPNKPKIAISIGDINGIGLEIALLSHKFVSKRCEPYYFIHESLLNKALKKLKLKKPPNFHCVEFENADKAYFSGGKSEKNLKFSGNFKFSANLECKFSEKFDIKAGKIDAKSGAYSFASFKFATKFVQMGFAKALITLPIHKKAWSEAGVAYKGHTQALSAFFGRQALMMLGCKRLFVGLFTEHIALKKVSALIKAPNLCEFLLNFHAQTGFKKIGVLSFNPHASDFGTIGGKEEGEISKAIKICNAFLNFKNLSKIRQKSLLKAHQIEPESLLENLLYDEILLSNLAASLEKTAKFRHFFLPNPIVADTAFTKNALKHCNRLVAMSHDLALAPLKALFFEESVNVSLNLPIIRVSPDHGTAFDKAYKGARICTKSYKNAINSALNLIKRRKNLARESYDLIHKSPKEPILRYLRRIKPKLAEEGIAQIGLFGSLARDEATINSDIDIFTERSEAFLAKRSGFAALIFLEDLRKSLEKRFYKKVDLCDKSAVSEEKRAEFFKGAIYA